MTHLWAVILGIVQGLAEFLPISSTAHLKLLPWIFGVRDPVLSSTEFDIALHAGSFVAILVALWPDWRDMVLGAVGSPSRGVDAGSVEHDPFRDPRLARRFLGFLVMTSIPAAIIGILFEKKVEYLSTPDIAGAVSTGVDAQTFHYAPLLLGTMLIVFGVLLWAADTYIKRQDALVRMTWSKSFIIGIAQAAALIPGVSRSGSTMMTGRLLGLGRQDVARYSFMAALPVIGGAAFFGLRHVSPSLLFSVDWVLGFLASAVSSVLVMRWMLRYVRDHSFAIFMWYRVVVGILIIALFFARG